MEAVISTGVTRMLCLICNLGEYFFRGHYEVNNEIQSPDLTSLPAQQPMSGEILAPKAAADALVEELSRGKGRKYLRLIMAALGSVPWVGALASFSAEKDQQQLNDLVKLYVQEQQPKLQELQETIVDIIDRLDGMGEEVQQRVESPEYLTLVRRAFRSWDEADTAEKREYIKRLITNAGAINLCPDDLIRIFISWIDGYHESHFAVIRQIYQNPNITKAAIWDNLNNGVRAKEDSAEAGLFRYLMRELSMGGVIEITKQRDFDGRAFKATPTRASHGAGSKLAESTYEDTKPQVLTELGQQFVRYVLNDVIKRVEG
jgi:hypothetical protein